MKHLDDVEEQDYEHDPDVADYDNEGEGATDYEMFNRLLIKEQIRKDPNLWQKLDDIWESDGDDHLWNDMTDISLVVEPHSKHSVALNPQLIDQQDLTIKEVKYIKQLHAGKIDILDRMDKLNDRIQLQFYARVITNIDYELQKAWKFPQDQRFHRWWEIPKCSCDNRINEEQWSTSYGIYSNDCIIHGDDTPKLNINITITYTA